jgi:hypothetical protein
MQALPHARSLPVSEASPACHPTSTAQFLGQHLPRNAAPQDKHDPCQSSAVGDAAWPSTFGLRRFWWEERGDDLPQHVGDKWCTHAANLPHGLGSVRRTKYPEDASMLYLPS